LDKSQSEFKEIMLEQIEELTLELKGHIESQKEEEFDIDIKDYDFFIRRFPTGILMLIPYNVDFTFDFYSVESLAEFYVVNKELFYVVGDIDDDHYHTPISNMPCGCPATIIENVITSNIQELLNDGHAINFGTEHEEGWEHGVIIPIPESNEFVSQVFFPDGDENEPRIMNKSEAMEILALLVDREHDFSFGEAVGVKREDGIAVVCGQG
jgi:hypothetical protein